MMPDGRLPRLLDMREVVAHRSCFLFGPRQTGKSTLIRQQFPAAPVYNLLDRELFLRLSRNPALIRQALLSEREGEREGEKEGEKEGEREDRAKGEARDGGTRSATDVLIIDEIQKMPELLNEVQLMIDEHGVRFLLTGSSARALRRKGVNLLGGRARSRTLHPFVRAELGSRFDLRRAMEFGLLPPIYFSDALREDLAAYAGDYLREEIAAEAVVRNVGAFSRFLEVAALAHGEMINFTNLASDAQVPVSTVREYYEILKDTLLAHQVPAFTETVRRKAIQTAKYYLFDIGVARYLQGRRGLARGTAEYGSAFESFIFQEIKAFCDYRRLDTPRYWRSRSQFEVDFVFGGVAVEVKAKRVIGARDLRGIGALREEGLLNDYIVVSMEAVPRRVDGIRILPWAVFLDELWGDVRLVGGSTAAA